MKKIFLNIYSKILYIIFIWVSTLHEWNTFAIIDDKHDIIAWWLVADPIPNISIFDKIISYIILFLYLITLIYFIIWLFYYIKSIKKKDKQRKVKWIKFMFYSLISFLVLFVIIPELIIQISMYIR